MEKKHGTERTDRQDTGAFRRYRSGPAGPVPTFIEGGKQERIKPNDGVSFSDIIIGQAKQNLGKDFYKNLYQVIGFVNDEDYNNIINSPQELFAYAMETKMGGINNPVAEEIHRLTMEYYNVHYPRAN